MPAPASAPARDRREAARASVFCRALFDTPARGDVIIICCTTSTPEPAAGAAAATAELLDDAARANVGNARVDTPASGDVPIASCAAASALAAAATTEARRADARRKSGIGKVRLDAPASGDIETTLRREESSPPRAGDASSVGPTRPRRDVHTEDCIALADDDARASGRDDSGRASGRIDGARRSGGRDGGGGSGGDEEDEEETRPTVMRLVLVPSLNETPADPRSPAAASDNAAAPTSLSADGESSDLCRRMLDARRGRRSAAAAAAFSASADEGDGYPAAARGGDAGTSTARGDTRTREEADEGASDAAAASPAALGDRMLRMDCQSERRGAAIASPPPPPPPPLSTLGIRMCGSGANAMLPRTSASLELAPPRRRDDTDTRGGGADEDDASPPAAAPAAAAVRPLRPRSWRR